MIPFSVTSSSVSVDASTWDCNLYTIGKRYHLSAIPLERQQLEAIDAHIESGLSLFGSGLVPNAITVIGNIFIAIDKDKTSGLTSAQFAKKIGEKFDFGFIQGISNGSKIEEYWGQRKSDGLAIKTTKLNDDFQIDTSSIMQPWTRTKPRFSIVDMTDTLGKQYKYQIVTRMADHPYTYGLVSGQSSGTRMLLRRAMSKRDFRTILVYRENSSVDAFGLSSFAWSVTHNHVAKYKLKPDSTIDVDLTKTEVAGPALHPGRPPSSGKAENIADVEKKLLAGAFQSGPFLTEFDLALMYKDKKRIELKTEPTNERHFADFWA
jgi:hypothetical protein